MFRGSRIEFDFSVVAIRYFPSFRSTLCVSELRWSPKSRKSEENCMQLQQAVYTKMQTGKLYRVSKAAGHSSMVKDGQRSQQDFP